MVIDPGTIVPMMGRDSENEIKNARILPICGLCCKYVTIEAKKA
jgi:hypothetical protein